MKDAKALRLCRTLLIQAGTGTLLQAADEIGISKDRVRKIMGWTPKELIARIDALESYRRFQAQTLVNKEI